MASHVLSKLEEGDFKGAVNLACSEDTIADMSDDTWSALEQKHPSPHPGSCIHPSLQVSAVHTVPVSVEEVANAIRSFPNGSAGGPDGVRPQHLKDVVGHSTADRDHGLLSALAFFLSLAAKRRAIDAASGAHSNRETTVADTLGASQVFWRWETGPTGGGWS